jgi:hypothetical protein
VQNIPVGCMARRRRATASHALSADAQPCCSTPSLTLVTSIPGRLTSQPDAERRFMEVKAAFSVLSDAQQRADYDRRQRAGVSAPCASRGRPPGPAGASAFRGVPAPRSVSESGGTSLGVAAAAFRSEQGQGR